MEIEKLATFYDRLEPIVNQLKAAGKLQTPVKEGGWTPKQLIHHLADAQTQAFYRILWILTEDYSVIKPFDQDDWMDITEDFPVDASLAQLKAIYTRWYHMMKDLDPSLYDKSAWHPESGLVSIGPLTEYYIDHGESHVSQFAALVE